MKNLPYVIHLLSICILSLLLNSCKDKDCHKDGTCAPDYRKMPLGGSKDYLYALKGSYWIYENTFTGDIDTQTCLGFICDTIIVKGDYPDTKHITIEYERIWRMINSTYSKSYILDETAGYNPNSPRELKAILEREVRGHGFKAFFFPFVVDESIGQAISLTTFKEIDSTMNLQGKIFSNVATFTVDIDPIWENSPPYTSSKYYWAKGVGLVKRIAKNKPDNWELIDYKIIN